ncbi:MAG: BCAM0308 family protein [Vicinamibacterales bacterium]
MSRRTLRPTTASPAGSATRYGDRIFDDEPHDPYQSNGKYEQPTVCGDCNAVFHGGRWQWAGTPLAAHKARCPACRRTRDKLPAGTATLTGAFFDAHRDEVLALVRHAAAREQAERPLHRIMQIEEAPNGVGITTTDIHSPQRIAEALKHAYHGDFKLSYGHDEYTVRVNWQR